MSPLNVISATWRGARSVVALIVALILFSLSAPALANAGPLEKANFQVYTGDVNGDGREDLLMKATPQMVMIDLDDVSIPIPIPSPVPTFILMSDASGEYTLIANPNAQLVNAGWRKSDYKLSYEAPSSANGGVISINTSASQSVFKVAISSEGKDIDVVAVNGTVVLPTIAVTRSAPVANEAFKISWVTTRARSVSLVCTAVGTGYNTSENLTVNGSRSLVASQGWVEYPSTCTWTAVGLAGVTTYVDKLVTLPAQTRGVTYIHTDGLGSPVARTDGAGNLISRTYYEPYGNTAAGAQPTIGFTGHVNDADTGLTYMQQRYYDPVAGRFLSIDPVTTDAKAGSSFNRYSYASNSPYKYLDPDGRNPKLIADFALNVALNVLTTGEADLLGAAKETALGALNPLKTLQTAGKIAKAFNKAEGAAK